MTGNFAYQSKEDKTVSTDDSDSKDQQPIQRITAMSWFVFIFIPMTFVPEY